jgi:hypothetical protein
LIQRKGMPVHSIRNYRYGLAGTERSKLVCFLLARGMQDVGFKKIAPGKQ